MTPTQPKRQPIPFGRYLLLDRINIGGMAEVWRGKMFGVGGFERLVAIKRILPNIAEDAEFISMFIDEAKISGQLNHANIAQISDQGQISNSYFIAMEYIPGKDMRALFDRCQKRSEPAPVPLVAYVVSKMCEGLDYAHRKKDTQGQDLNIVHRDVSPQNILISFEGEVKVIDFGIANVVGKATMTQAGILKGKFGYMSPEQIRGLPLDRRSDIFAIGVCLYELLTGQRLFVGDTDFSVLEKVRKAEVDPPSLYNRRIPEALEKIVLKALARDVDERYQYANELGDELLRFLLTSDSLFGRKDLMQYMKSTFAEDVEREKLRLQEYADLKPPEGMLAAVEMGFSGASSAPRVQVPASTPVPSPPPVSPPLPATPGLGDVRHAPTPGALPKVTASAPTALPVPEEEEAAATLVIRGSKYLEEPTSQPGLVGTGRRVTPVEVPRPPVIDEQPPQHMARVRTPPLMEEAPESQGPMERTPAKVAPNRLPLIVGLAALLSLLAGVAGFVMSRPAPMGSIQVTVSAEGFRPFTQEVLLKEGMTSTRVEVTLEPQVRMARMMVVTQPPDAELKVDGQVVRQKGSSSTYFAELPEGPEVEVEASAPGFKPVRQRITLAAGDKPMDVQLKLEADGFEVEVASIPSGAIIVAGGRKWGVTPARVRLPGGVQQVSLKLRCHEGVDMAVAPGSGPVKGRLKKQRGCR